MRRLLKLILAAMALASSASAEPGTAPSAAAPVRVEARVVGDPEPVPGTGMLRYRTIDGYGREIVFYMGKPKDQTRLPLVVYVHGSGSQSNFVKFGEKIGVGNGGGTVFQVFAGKARVMIVEKPGVAFLDQPKQPGGAMEASEEFRREHTLERWAEAVRAALDAARTLPQVDGSRVLVAGHSEGGLVACRVARLEPAVTDVAVLSGGGATQLFDLVRLARQGVVYPVSDKAEERVEALLRDWRGVLADPGSADKMFMGHPYRRWSTFLADSPVQELSQTKARVFIGQGAADDAVDPASFDVLYTSLLAQGRDVTGTLVEGADHSFAKKGETAGEGWTALWKRVVEWYVPGAGAAAGGASKPGS